MSRRTRRALLLALSVALTGLVFTRLPFWSANLIASRLSSLLDRPVSVGEVRYHLFPFEAEVLDLRVLALEPGGPPFLELPRVVVAPSVRTLFSTRIVLSRVRIQGMKLRIHAPLGGGDDIPRPAKHGSGGGTEVRVRRLVLEEGELYLNHERVPLQLDLPNFAGRLSQRRGGAMGGTLAWGPGTLQFGSSPVWPLGTDIDLVLDGNLLTIERGRLRSSSGKTDLDYTGTLRILQDPIGAFQLTGPVDLGELEHHLMQTGLGIKGDARFKGDLTVEGPRLRIKGRMEGTSGEFLATPIPRFAGEIAWNEKGVTLKGLEVDTLGGGGTVDLEVPPGPAMAKMESVLHDVDVEGLVMPIFNVGAAGMGSAATGQIAIRWPKGHMRALSGRIALDLTPRPDGRTPAHGRLEWRAEKGLQFIEKADLRTPATYALLAGRIEIDDRADMSVDVETSDLAEADDLAMRIRRALGTVDAGRAGFTGSGAFHGTWRGTLPVPVFEGRASGRDVGYLDVVWGAAEWSGAADPYEVRSHSLVVRRPGGELWVDGRIETGLLGERDAVDVKVRFANWSAASFIKAFDWNLDASGLLSGEARINGTRSAPFGEVQVNAKEGKYYGIPYEDLDLKSQLRGTVTDVTAASAKLGGGRVMFRGTVTDDGFYDGSAEVQEAEVGELLPPLAGDVRLGGRVSGEVTLAGTLERPRALGRLFSPRLFLGDEGIGAVDASLRARGDGWVFWDVRGKSPRVDLALSGAVGADKPYSASFQLTARQTSLDPFLRSFLPGVSPLLGIVATGTLDVRGPLLAPRDLSVEAAVPDLELRLPEYPIRSREPLHAVLEGGRLRVRDFHLAGEGTDLAVDGSVALFEDGPVGVSIRGAADLRALSAVTRRLRGRGAARLSMTVSGTRDAPRADGNLDLEGAGVRVRGFPHGLDDVRGSVHFSESSAHFKDVTGTVGGGPVEVEGEAAYAHGKLASFDVHASGRGLALRYPEGLRSALDGDLRFFGDAVRQWVTGTIEVRQALWTRRYDVASELLSTGSAREAEAGAGLAEGVHYDIQVRAPGTVRIDNNLATLVARANLTISGTSDTPALLGRAEVERGRVYFQGNTYVIQRGVIDFANPQKTDPLFDIEAETRVRTYRVTLKINGTLERVYPTLTSDPPLTSVQILNLLAGAEEATVESLARSQTDQANLAAAGAATLAAGRLSEEVGLERGAERIFGLNRFSIDPSVIKGGLTNPSARLTVGKRITPDLNVLYSVDLKGTEERILSIEYTLSDRLSVLLTRTEPGGFGFDLRHRLREEPAREQHTR